MKKNIIILMGLSTLCVNSQAATQKLIWGDVAKSKSSHHGLLANHNQNYQLQLLDNDANDHQRYQVAYKGIPVWGHQLIMHKKNGNSPKITGYEVSGIEKDLPSLDPRFTDLDIENQLQQKINGTITFKHLEKVIFLDKKNKAHLAYHARYYTSSPSAQISAPTFIVDANSGKILKQWNNLHKIKIGQGLGGSMFSPQYRHGEFQYGDSQSNLQSLDKLDIKVKHKQCVYENKNVRVIDIRDRDPSHAFFPVFRPLEKILKFRAFKTPCSEESGYTHLMDADEPMNYSFSSNNDTMYFATKTMEMYKQHYGVKRPLGKDLPVRAYTHLQLMDNDFALPTIRIKGVIIAHQQIVIGNGDMMLTPSAQSTIAHELSHNFTSEHSGLNYEGQSGGINESFSDMAAFALQDYIRKQHPWYWDGKDWSFASESTIGAVPLRYMDSPRKDGQSIDNAEDYYEGLDVHLSSGVFNKAFYLLATTPGWSVEKAFRVMLDANSNYWMPMSGFDSAACGVIQATKDKGWDKKAPIAAFQEVGVSCPLHL